MTHSPADVLAHYLIAQDLFTDPTASSIWPLFVSNLPDDKNIEADAAAVFDSPGTKDGRYMRGGKTIFHYGTMVMIRSGNHPDGYAKADAIITALDALDSASVTIDNTEYTIENASVVGPPIALGNEDGTRRRQLHTVNAMLTILEV